MLTWGSTKSVFTVWTVLQHFSCLLRFFGWKFHRHMQSGCRGEWVQSSETVKRQVPSWTVTESHVSCLMAPFVTGCLLFSFWLNWAWPQIDPVNIHIIIGNVSRRHHITCCLSSSPVSPFIWRRQIVASGSLPGCCSGCWWAYFVGCRLGLQSNPHNVFQTSQPSTFGNRGLVFDILRLTREGVWEKKSDSCHFTMLRLNLLCLLLRQIRQSSFKVLLQVWALWLYLMPR